MSVVDIRVDLPSHSRSFTLNVPSDATVLQLKQEIYRTCPGQPRIDGQRLICRGRQLADDESIDSLWKVGFGTIGSSSYSPQYRRQTRLG